MKCFIIECLKALKESRENIKELLKIHIHTNIVNTIDKYLYPEVSVSNYELYQIYNKLKNDKDTKNNKYKNCIDNIKILYPEIEEHSQEKKYKIKKKTWW